MAMDTAKEKNIETLHSAIRQLPSIAPPEQVWFRIEQELGLAEAIRRLPDYHPPEEIWRRLNHELALRPPVRKKRTLFRLPYGIAAAATLTLFAISLWWLASLPGEQVSLSYTTEMSQQMAIPPDWDNENDQFKRILQLAQQSPVVDPSELAVLASELEELETAKQALLALYQKYGDDPDIARKIAGLERERSAVLRQIAGLI